MDETLRGFHKHCIQRKLRRAEREGLTYEAGQSESLVLQFYRLLILTRKRLRLPPQPVAWFRNLIVCLGEKSKIHLAAKDGRPVASIVTLRHKGTLVYKYGASDKSASRLGGMQLLLWRAIQEAKCDGFEELDLGRSDWDQAGLIAFKDHWGASRSVLNYWRYPALSSQSIVAGFGMRVAGHMFGLAPDGLASAAGRFLYRHLG